MKEAYRSTATWLPHAVEVVLHPGAEVPPLGLAFQLQQVLGFPNQLASCSAVPVWRWAELVWRRAVPVGELVSCWPEEAFRLERVFCRVALVARRVWRA